MVVSLGRPCSGGVSIHPLPSGSLPLVLSTAGGAGWASPPTSCLPASAHMLHPTGRPPQGRWAGVWGPWLGADTPSLCSLPGAGLVSPHRSGPSARPTPQRLGACAASWVSVLPQVNSVNCNTSWKINLFMQFRDHLEEVLKGVRTADTPSPAALPAPGPLACLCPPAGTRLCSLSGPPSTHPLIWLYTPSSPPTLQGCPQLPRLASPHEERLHPLPVLAELTLFSGKGVWAQIL